MAKLISGNINEPSGAKAPTRSMMQRKGALLAVFSLGLAASTPANAQESSDSTNWSVRLGAGYATAPTFEGADSHEPVPLPVVDMKWKDRLSIGVQGLQLTLLGGNRGRLGVGLGYNPGRDEGDDEALEGLGEVDPAIEAGIFATLRAGNWSLTSRLGHDVSDGHGGTMMRAGLTYNTKIAEDLHASLGPGLSWASRNYMQSFFGVTPEQSARSGLRRFNPEAGIKNIELNAHITYTFAQRWFVSTNGRYARLIGGAADSPIVQSRNQFFLGTFLGYAF